jgi:hypothetical protein
MSLNLKLSARRLLVGGSLAFLAGCSGESSIRGSYINHDDSNGGFLVQIDDVQDHTVHGTLSIVATDAKGEVIARRTPISGTVDGKALNLTIENGNGSGMATGSVVPAGLQLTLLGNGQSMRLLFKRANAAEFDKIVSDVRAKSAHARQDTATAAIQDEHTKELVNVQRAVESAADRLFADAQSATEKSRRIENVIAGYPRFAARAAQLRAAARQIDARDDDSGRLQDISWRLSANRDTVADAHSDAQGAARDLESSRSADLGRVNQLLAECQNDRRLTCTRLAEAFSAYSAGSNNLRAAIVREASAFDAERSRF